MTWADGRLANAGVSQEIRVKFTGHSFSALKPSTPAPVFYVGAVENLSAGGTAGNGIRAVERVNVLTPTD
jgi:hypothetical protein